MHHNRQAQSDSEKPRNPAVSGPFVRTGDWRMISSKGQKTWMQQNPIGQIQSESAARRIVVLYGVTRASGKRSMPISVATPAMMKELMPQSRSAMSRGVPSNADIVILSKTTSLGNGLSSGTN